MLRGGFGLFYERTPSTVGAFTHVRHGARSAICRRRRDAARSRRLLRAHGCRSADAAQPDMGHRHRSSLQQMWSVHLGLLDREGSHELVVDPLQTGTAGELRLTSDGRSTYLGAEVGVHFSYGDRADVNVIVHAFARARRSEHAVELLRHGHVARVRQKRVRGLADRRAQPAARARTLHAVAEVARHRHRRLAQRPAVLRHR